MTAPGGITKNWVLVTCDLKEGRCQVRSSYGVMTKVREQKLARGTQAPRGEWAKTQSKPAEHLATPQVFIAYSQLCTFTLKMQSPSHVATCVKVPPRREGGAPHFSSPRNIDILLGVHGSMTHRNITPLCRLPGPHPHH